VSANKNKIAPLIAKVVNPRIERQVAVKDSARNLGLTQSAVMLGQLLENAFLKSGVVSHVPITLLLTFQVRDSMVAYEILYLDGRWRELG
jgi:hypothetical protein